MYFFLHFSQNSTFVLPCNSAILSEGKPDFKWRPSTFWEIIYYNKFFLSNSTKHIWVLEGIADSMGTLWYFLGSSFIFYAYFSQHPGPVFKTVFIPDLKSGTPD